MDLSFLKSPEFWVATVVIPFLIQKYFLQIDRFIAAFVRTIIVRLPSTIRLWRRNRRAKYLKKLKIDRWSTSRIFFEISKTNAMFMLFCGVIGVYLMTLISGSGVDLIKANFVLGIFLTSPIYLFEAVWLAQDLYTQKLIRSREKIRRKSTFN